jgi:hypothetical protein
MSTPRPSFAMFSHKVQGARSAQFSAHSVAAHQIVTAVTVLVIPGSTDIV